MGSHYELFRLCCDLEKIKHFLFWTFVYYTNLSFLTLTSDLNRSKIGITLWQNGNDDYVEIGK